MSYLSYFKGRIESIQDKKLIKLVNRFWIKIFLFDKYLYRKGVLVLVCSHRRKSLNKKRKKKYGSWTVEMFILNLFDQ